MDSVILTTFMDSTRKTSGALGLGEGAGKGLGYAKGTKQCDAPLLVHTDGRSSLHVSVPLGGRAVSVALKGWVCRMTTAGAQGSQGRVEAPETTPSVTTTWEQQSPHGVVWQTELCYAQLLCTRNVFLGATM